MKKILLLLFVCFLVAPVSANNNFFALDGGRGPELVVNGNFSAWTADNPDSWAISAESGSVYVTEVAGKCRFVSDGTLFSMYQTKMTIGMMYLITFDIISITGTISAGDSASAVNFTTTGTKTIYHTASATNGPYFKRVGAVDVVLDNVSCKQIF